MFRPPQEMKCAYRAQKNKPNSEKKFAAEMFKEKDAKYSDQMMAKWRGGTVRRAPQITAKRFY
eukprot:996279-Pyramimonas_sp.AAC.2